MKFKKGQQFTLNDETIETLGYGSTFMILDSLEGIDYPYLVKFENGREMALNEEEICEFIQ